MKCHSLSCTNFRNQLQSAPWSTNILAISRCPFSIACMSGEESSVFWFKLRRTKGVLSPRSTYKNSPHHVCVAHLACCMKHRKFGSQTPRVDGVNSIQQQNHHLRSDQIWLWYKIEEGSSASVNPDKPRARGGSVPSSNFRTEKRGRVLQHMRCPLSIAKQIDNSFILYLLHHFSCCNCVWGVVLRKLHQVENLWLISTLRAKNGNSEGREEGRNPNQRRERRSHSHSEIGAMVSRIVLQEKSNEWMHFVNSKPLLPQWATIRDLTKSTLRRDPELHPLRVYQLQQQQMQ